MSVAKWEDFMKNANKAWYDPIENKYYVKTHKGEKIEVDKTLYENTIKYFEDSKAKKQNAVNKMLKKLKR